MSVRWATLTDVPRQHIVYKPAERPMCEVLVGGRWVPAEVRARMQAKDGSWSAAVGYNTGPGENRLGTFTADQLRAVDAAT